MLERTCAHCSKPFLVRPQVPQQAFCSATECQRSRRSQWLKQRLRDDPDFTPSRSTRVRWLIEELGVKFDAVPVDLMAGEHKGAAFLSVNPAGKVPVLIDGELVLTETMAIVLYLAENDEQRRFLPADRAQRAQVYRWLSFAITELEQPLWRMRRHAKLYAVERRLAAEVDLSREDFAAMARVLEVHMHERPFVAGPTVSVADFVVAWTLDWAHANALLEHSPNLLAYLKRSIAARPRPRECAPRAHPVDPYGASGSP